MNTVNTEKHLMSKTIKNTALVLVISLTSLFSINASAQNTANIEEAISSFIVAQGQQVMTQLNEQLQKTIAEDIKKVSTALSMPDVAQGVSQSMVSDKEVTSENNEPIIAQVNSNNK